MDDNATSTSYTHSMDASERILDSDCRDPLTGSLSAATKAKLMQLLGQWEEPSKAYQHGHVSPIILLFRYSVASLFLPSYTFHFLQFSRLKFEIASISAVLRFRKALTFINHNYPFSYAFGPGKSCCN